MTSGATEAEVSYEKLVKAAQRHAEQARYINHPTTAFASMRTLADDVDALARAVLDQQAEIEHLRELMSCAVYTKLNSAYQAKEVEIERLQRELRIEKASQATRGNN